MIESGFLIVAELTGMPSAAAGGLGHALRNRTALLRAVAGRLTPGLEIERVEDNRVLATAPDGALPNAAVLFDLIDAAYVAFRAARDEILDSRACTCQACERTSGARLRWVAHHGRWTRVTGRDGSFPAGPEVSLAVRLLADPALAAGSHLLVTDAALQRTGIDREVAGMRPLGAGNGGAAGATSDLELAWDRAARSLRLDPEDVVATVDVVLPVKPTVAWDWLTAPDKRTLWEEVDSIECVPRSDGRAGVGTRYRSLHGKQVDEVREVLDWKPFRCWTWDLSTRKRRLRATVELSEADGGTRVIHTIGVPKGSALLARLRARAAIRGRVAPERAERLERLRTLLEVERRLGARTL
jgi:hypothetical protein